MLIMTGLNIKSGHDESWDDGSPHSAAFQQVGEEQETG